MTTIRIYWFVTYLFYGKLGRSQTHNHTICYILGIEKLNYICICEAVRTVLLKRNQRGIHLMRSRLTRYYYNIFDNAFCHR